MHRWELVSGGSAKFWEVAQDGAAVTVRFGRIGTAGQTQTKELASAEAATTHVAKLVAEKEKKGYSAVATTAAATASPAAPAPGQPSAAAQSATTGATPAAQPTTAGATNPPTAPDEQPPAATPPSGTPAPQPLAHSSTPAPTEPPAADTPATDHAAAVVDEDAWEMPKAWLRHVVRQRGFTPPPEFILDLDLAAEARSQVTVNAGAVGRALTAQGTSAELVSATREHLAGRPNPVGAAAVATITACGLPSVHAWIADHGVAFAAEAVVEFMGLAYSEEWDSVRSKQTNCRLHRVTDGFQTALDRVEGRMLTAVRYALAVADDAERAAAETALEEMAATDTVRELRSYLLPERSDWFAEVCALPYTSSKWWMLPCTARSHEDFVRADSSLTNSAFVLYTAVYVLGPAVAPLLAQELDQEYVWAEGVKQAVKVLAALPADEAFTVLLDRLDRKYVRPAVLTAMAAFPRRAARLLGERVSGNADVQQLLSAHLRTHPTLDVPADVLAVLAESEVESWPEADVDQLPPLLVSPPWRDRRPAAKPVVLEGLPVPAGSVRWEEGEREQWLASGREWISTHHDWRKLLADYRSGIVGYHDNDLFLLAPENEVRPLLAQWQPNYHYGVEEWGKQLAARFGADAVAPLTKLAQSSPAQGGVVLLPFATAEVAAVMAGWFARTKLPRRWALAWLARHREQAALLLIPAAAGKPGAARRDAEAALRHLHGLGVDVAGLAASCGAQAAIDAVLAVNPVDVLPAKLPVLGDWADVRMLPQVLLRGRTHALPAEASASLLMTAALSKPGEVYAGLPIAREALDPASLAAFAWAVFEQWYRAGGPSKESWALHALGWFGDDSTVRKLSPLIRSWPGESQHARAVTALDVLADIGTEVALSHLNGIAEKVKFKGLKTRAQEKVSQIAAELGLSRDQLADRLVPRLGLDDEASLVINYGPRQFRVGFDEQLKPYVLDPDGKRRKDLPKPGAKDDQELAPLEHKRFTTLKKDVRTVASDQIQRLERAMVDQRAWTEEEFRTVLAAHPLLWHIVRRLVWITDSGLSFRLAEDRTLADSNDGEVTLPQDATVRVAHPVTLGDSLAAWGEVFADYEILQPFPQLGRPLHVPDRGEDLLPRLRKYCGTSHPIGKILGLTKKGWVRGEPQDAGVECWITRPFPGGGALVASLDPGIAVGAMDVFPEVGFSDMWFSPSGHGGWSPPKDAPATYAVDPITTSEILSELESLQP
ncbi:DUF4132 domain-containing protein [Nocardia sp. NRRL S-836]|uniref:DUF4132 domain-containing protein n=1 Tax=Nocardia sp. NRRL S-836 TaxID=1519492 RepID=UPI0006AE99CC|nr:DUF4132 domain-containing protein [Nocardia sp. NRRL S-836]